VSPVRHELGFYIPEDAILHSHRCENLKSRILSGLFLLPTLVPLLLYSLMIRPNL
jgi:hypothetical protein